MSIEQEIAVAKADAAAKVAAIPAREAELFGEAVKEGRKPFRLTPHTAVNAAVVRAIIDKIKTAPEGVGAIVKAQRAACEGMGDIEVALLSSDVLAIINAAEGSGGKVPG